MIDLFSIPKALALGVPDADTIMTQVAGSLGSTVTGGGDNVGEIAFSFMGQVAPLMYGIAGLIVVVTGLILIVSQDENQLATARKTLFAAIASVILVKMSDIIFQIFTGTTVGGGITAVTGPNAGGAALASTEIAGMISFLEIPIGTIAILMIIVSGIKSVIALGNDNGPQQLRRTVVSVVVGMVLISSKILIANTFGVSGSAAPTAAIDEAMGHVATVVSFMGLAALVMVCIAGMYMVVNRGDADAVNKARGLIIRTLVGLVVIGVSYNIFAVFFL